MIYDLIILGAGPAGSSGAVYASRKRLKTLLITESFGGQSVDSVDIQNWIGTVSISGLDLAKSLEEHVKAYADDVLEIKSGYRVEKVIDNKDGTFTVTLEDSDETFTTKSVLFTLGSVRRKLPAKGAAELEHKGLTYCASCDGPIFTEKDVAVIGGGNAAFETAAQLLAYTKSVTLFNRSDSFRADEVTVEKVLQNEKITALTNVDILEVLGDKMVEGIKYKDTSTGQEKELKVEGVFVEIGQIPNTSSVQGIVDIDEYGKIKIDHKSQRTSKPGIWAAGDCTDILYHQNNIAAGDAVKALEDIYFYLHTGK